jgi:signal transduction histidine kinase
MLNRQVKRRTEQVEESNKKLSISNQQLALTNEQLKVHDKMQKEFINIASHEMKTPTQAILGYTHLLEKYPEKKDEILEVLKRNGNRLQRLTADILDVTRIESQTLKLNKEQLNLNDVILSIVEDNKNEVEKRYHGKVKLLFEPKEDRIAIKVDKNRLSQVLSNLINNAIKFTKEGTITVDVERRNSSSNNKNSNDDNEDEEDVIVSVKDTGTGIDPEILPRLFSKFATKSETGTGLGLYISKSIIEAHGGRIWAENYEYDGKKGAVFAFSLPQVVKKVKRGGRVEE